MDFGGILFQRPAAVMLVNILQGEGNQMLFKLVPFLLVDRICKTGQIQEKQPHGELIDGVRG